MPQFRFYVSNADQRPRPILAFVQILLGLIILVAVAATAGFLLLGVLLIGVPALFLFLWWLRLKATWREYRFHQGLKTAGRTTTWKDVEPELNTGRGTLIFELNAGRTRVWWTTEDALGPEGEALPTRLPVIGAMFGLQSQSDEEVMLARQIGEWYLDSESGRASLVADFPLDELPRFKSNYPRLRAVTLVTDFSPPLIALGTPQETTQPPEAGTSERRVNEESRRLPSA